MTSDTIDAMLKKVEGIQEESQVLISKKTLSVISKT